MLVVILLNLLGFVLEVSGGILLGSVALLTDGLHMLFDMSAYTVAFIAMYVAGRSSNYHKHRVEPLAALVNAVLLFVLVGFILFESYNRVSNPTDIDTGLVVVISVIGLLINLLSVYVLETDDMSLNERGAVYHLLGDTGGSIGVIVAMVGVAVTGNQVIDPIIAVIIAILILWSAVRILINTKRIFMHNSPVDESTLRRRMNNISSVESVCCVHTWQICSQITAATVHLASSENQDEVRNQVHNILKDYSIDHSTVEVRDSGQSFKYCEHDH